MVQILFVISILSLLVLVGAAAAIIHHVRSNRRNRSTQAPPPEPSFSEHLYSAAEYGTPRSPRLVPHQTVQSITAKKDLDPTSNAHDESRTSHRKLPHIIHRNMDSTPPASFLPRVAGARKASFRHL